MTVFVSDCRCRLAEVLKAKRRKFASDARGAVAVLVALAAVPLIGTIGIGVDTARGYIAQSRLSAAVDAAALAGGNDFFGETQRDADINKIFRANFPDGYLDASVSGPTITEDKANQKITVAASAAIPVTFMRLFGHKTVTVSASAEVTRKMKALDVVLSMDISGSMDNKDGRTTTRLEASQQAANELITILFGGNTSKKLLNIGLVPWSSKVNVMEKGKPFNAGLTETVPVSTFTAPDINRVQSKVYYANSSPTVPLLEPPPANWKGCVFNRYIEDKPGNDDDNDGDIRDGPFSGGGKNWPGWAPVLPGDYPDATVAAKWGGEPVDGEYYDEKKRKWKEKRCALAPSDKECTPCPPVGITPLQNSKKDITDAVDELAADGNTNLPAGLGWAWRVLTTGEPFEHTVSTEYTPDRAIVLMTDGENYAAYGDGYKAVFGLGGTARDKMNARAEKLAANIKKTGVVIYVVQFVDASSALKAFLKKVASGPDAPYYYYAPDPSALQGAFHEIANHLSELRLSK